LFPFIADPVFSLISERDKEEGYEDVLETTLLGDTINQSELNLDFYTIFNPIAVKTEGDRFTFSQVTSGWGALPNSTPKGFVNICEIYNWNRAGDEWLLNRLMRRGSFQFVSAPGTEREQRWRVRKGGQLQRIGSRTVNTGFFIKPMGANGELTGWGLAGQATSSGPVVWTDDDGKPTDRRSICDYTTVFRDSLLVLRDVFYALNRLDEEALALYGRVTGTCCVCGRALDDAASLNRGIGPSCWNDLRRGPAPLYAGLSS